MNIADFDISDLFDSASTYLAEHSSISLSNDAKLKLYAYYKQSTQGDCTTAKPSLFEFVARAKWEAWKKLEGMKEQDAMQRYVETVVGMGCGWDPEGNHREEEAIGGEESSEQAMGNTVSTMMYGEKDSSDEPHDIFFHVKEGDLVATLNTLDENVDINEKDYQGLSPLHWACDRGRMEIVEALLKRGADVNILSDENETPLHYACLSERLDIARLLIEYGADMAIRDEEGNMALDGASSSFAALVLEK